MAVLNKIRERSVFLIIIIALALFAFVLADVIRTGGANSQKAQSSVGVVNGHEIGREGFAAQVDAYQRNLGPQAGTTMAVNLVWDMSLRGVLLQEQLDELGVRVEKSQIRNILAQELGNNPNFTNEAGMFDEARLREYVATLRATSPVAYEQWIDFENSLGESAREDIYFDLIRAGVSATIPEGEMAYRKNADKVDLSFVQIPYSSISSEEVEVSKAEIASYLKEHSARFQTEASRDIQYVHFPEEASEEDDQEVQNMVAALLEQRVEYNPVTQQNDTLPGFAGVEDVDLFVNENSDQPYSKQFYFKNQLPAEHADELFNLEVGETYGPFKQNNSWMLSRMMEIGQIADSAQARHILITYTGTPAAQGVERTKQEAEALADSIVGVVRADRGEFENLAAQLSADQSNKDNAGELGWFAPGTMVPAFNDFVFNNNEGDIGVVESQFGFHVIDIQEQTAKKKAVQIASIVRSVEPSNESRSNLFAKVSRFEIAAKEGNFADVAKDNNENLRPVKGIGILDERIPGLGAQRNVVLWAFEDNVKAGDIRRFEINDGYVIAQVTAVNPEGLQTVESASSVVTPIIENQKKAEIIKSRIKGNSLSEIASSESVSVQNASSVSRQSTTLPGAGNEPLVVGAAFAMETGQVSEPITGKNGVYVIEVKDKRRGEDLESYGTYALRETVKRRGDIQQGVIEALKESAKIEDNRADFY